MSNRIQSIVVGVAEPHAGDPPLEAALDLARRTGATLHAVHAFALPVPSYTHTTIQYADTQGAAGYTEEVRERFERSLHAHFREDPMVCHATPGPAERAIIDTALSVQADVIVVGATHRGPLGRALLGTTAQRVLRESPCPVFVIHSIPVAPRRLMITTDLSDGSASVYERALDLVEVAYGTGATEIRAMLSVFPSPTAPALAAPALHEAAGEALAAFLADRRPRIRSATPVLRYGLPASEISAEAKGWNADLVVLGTHARTGLTRWLLGSVAEATLRDLPCNALVIPPAALVAEASGSAPVAGSAER
jgi:nucleotide-binding universal stress UspA family protein